MIHRNNFPANFIYNLDILFWSVLQAGQVLPVFDGFMVFSVTCIILCSLEIHRTHKILSRIFHKVICANEDSVWFKLLACRTVTIYYDKT